MEFEEWFKQQDFYLNLLYVHGEALFLKDHDTNTYRVIAVQAAYKAFNH